jgi:hypothetical protein
MATAVLYMRPPCSNGAPTTITGITLRLASTRRLSWACTASISAPCCSRSSMA